MNWQPSSIPIDLLIPLGSAPTVVAAGLTYDFNKIATFYRGEE
jgi:hypothetical protein